VRNRKGQISPGDGVTLGDAVAAKSPMKMIYRKLSKTASLPVTCHRFVPTGFLCVDGMVSQTVLRDSSLITGLVASQLNAVLSRVGSEAGGYA